ncbi:hypothetical protein [Sulfurovum sp.]|uniref:hypothetical protein n=1 Tax=Sulfurovum sp. TaxID=1969726 RepID=UPI003562F772
MSNSTLHDEGWIALPIDAKFERMAKEMRVQRDQQYGNIYEETATDERWVGDLGEKVFDSWLKHENIQAFEWKKDNAAGQPDFILSNGIKIGIKTVKRKVPPRQDYTAQITAKHATEPIHFFFFMSYEIEKQTMWLLGGIDRERFLKEARYYSAGEKVHPKYEIRKGHEIYNIEIFKLLKPHDFLQNIINVPPVTRL